MGAATSEQDVARVLQVGKKRRSQRWGRWLGGLGLVAVIGGAVAAVKLRPAPAARYETARVTRGELRVTVTATGTLQALGAVEVGSEVSGRVQSVSVDYNQQVKAGQTLAEIDPVQLRAETTQSHMQASAAAAAVRQAQATEEETKLALDRALTQQAAGLVSAQAVEAARASHARAVASVASARAQASLSQASASSSDWRLTKTRITSPIDGIVLARLVEPGQTVAASFQTPVLFRLAADLTRMTLHVKVDEADIGRVKEGQAAEFHVDAHGERVFASKVESLRNEATTENNVVTYEGVLSVDNAERLLRPGMTATATIIADRRTDAVLVPNAALRFTPPAMTPGRP
ncbi:MAG: efflux RND transporter periplasmic adaptor subunit, partial [Myxococcales bacterium]